MSLFYRACAWTLTCDVCLIQKHLLTIKNLRGGEIVTYYKAELAGWLIIAENSNRPEVHVCPACVKGTR